MSPGRTALALRGSAGRGNRVKLETSKTNLSPERPIKIVPYIPRPPARGLLRRDTPRAGSGRDAGAGLDSLGPDPLGPARRSGQGSGPERRGDGPGRWGAGRASGSARDSGALGAKAVEWDARRQARAPAGQGGAGEDTGSGGAGVDRGRCGPRRASG